MSSSNDIKHLEDKVRELERAVKEMARAYLILSEYVRFDDSKIPNRASIFTKNGADRQVRAIAGQSQTEGDRMALSDIAKKMDKLNESMTMQPSEQRRQGGIRSRPLPRPK